MAANVPRSFSSSLSQPSASSPSCLFFKFQSLFSPRSVSFKSKSCCSITLAILALLFLNFTCAEIASSSSSSSPSSYSLSSFIATSRIKGLSHSDVDPKLLQWWNELEKNPLSNSFSINDADDFIYNSHDVRIKRALNSKKKFLPVESNINIGLLFFNTSFNSNFLNERSFLPHTQNIRLQLSDINLKQSIQDAKEKVRKRFDLIEPFLYQNNAMQKPGSIGWFISAAHKSSNQVKNYSRAALLSEEVTRLLVKQNKLNLDQIVYGLSNFDITKTSLWNNCPRSLSTLTCYPGRYRSFSGHCNNVEQAEWGSANMPFARALAPRYSDGVSEARKSISGNILPSARDVSLAIHQGREGPFSHMTTLTTFFGQFVFHDLAQVAQSTGYRGQRIRCCGIDKQDLIHPECLPIKVTTKDPFMSKLRQHCIEYVRSSPSIRGQCNLGPREQINQASSFLDGSVLYGSSREAAANLRAFVGGQLKSIRNGHGKELLPTQEDKNSLDCKMSGSRKCFKSGDDRVNENLGLVIIHTLFLREHNRIAKTLSTINPQWNDEEIFEEARKIVGAQLQHITYNEFLSSVLGDEIISNSKYSLQLKSEGFFDGYDMKVDPTVKNAVANAVFEFLFTNIPSKMERYSKDLNMIGSIEMHQSFFNPSDMYTNMLDQYLMGMIAQNGMSSDSLVTTQMTNTIDDDEGYDFVASAIQRGRDHGLAGYVEFRRACKIEPQVSKWEHLQTVIKSDVLKRLMALYKDINDIDLFTGGLAEKPIQGAMVGPTFGCLLARQFTELRKGDRFWYENDLPPSSFTKEQLSEIRKSSLARIICNNGDQTDFVQPQPLVTSDIFLNAFQYCSNSIIDEIDLTKWRTKPMNVNANFTVSDDVLRKQFIRAKRDVDEFRIYERNVKTRLRRYLPDIHSGALTQSQLMHYAVTRPKRQAIAISNQSAVFERATYGILHHIRQGRDRETSLDLTKDVSELIVSIEKIHLEEYIQNEILTFNQRINQDCDVTIVPCDHTSAFRTFNGWCNNLHNPSFGKGYSLFERFLPPIYEDGVSIPRMTSLRGKQLPSGRIISTVIHDDISTPHVRYSLATMQWGQFVDHDLTFTPQYLTAAGKLLDCRACNSHKTVHPECWPIAIPPNDKFFKSKKCLHFVRSLNAQKSLGRREQMNQLTSYLDGSAIYGSDNCEAKLLRLGREGKMNSTKNSIPGLKDLLPQYADNIECVAPSGVCFHAGDARASEQPSLASMHTIWMREHNRIASQLSRVNSHWSDERLYQNSRKIVGALVQQITYREFLPRLLGRDYVDRFDLVLKSNGYYDGYDSSCSATIKNEFSSAVFRLGHTLLKPSFLRLDANYKPSKEPLMLREAFFNSDMLYRPYAIDELLRGILTQSIETFDSAITEEVKNHLFEVPKQPFSGMDLISLNIQRARDHGINPYNSYRELCNMTRARTFDDLINEIPQSTIENLKKVYDHVDDIDLFTGGVSETSLHGALVGPTFGCLLGMTFRSLRKCDRFWYENSDRFTRFTEDQLAEIRKVRLSKVICTNGDSIKLVQKEAMDMPDPFLNPRIRCSSLLQMDLTKWKDFDRSCMIKNKLIQIGQVKHISPCVNCACTLEGVVCKTVKIKNCSQLINDFSRDDIISDQSCVVQCAYAMRNNHIQSSSMRTLMSMFTEQ